MPRVTRAQAEAAEHAVQRLVSLALQVPEDKVPFGWNPREDYGLIFSTLRAYLAQRPDEDTVRKGHEFADELADHDSECYVASGCSGTCRSARAKAAIRAAMYQPEDGVRARTDVGSKGAWAEEEGYGYEEEA